MDIMTGWFSEAGLTFVAVVFGAVWTAFRSTEWYGRVQERRIARAIHALEAGVERTYRTYVQAIKTSSADGKLSEEERRRARELAKETAILYGRTEGLDVMRELGEAYLDLWIGKLVKRLKA